MCVDPTRPLVTERVSPPGEEQTLIIFKDDAIQRRLILPIARVLEEIFQLRPDWKTRKVIKPTPEELNELLSWDQPSVKKTGQQMVQHLRDKLDLIKKQFGTEDPLEIARQIRDNNLVYLSSGVLIGVVFTGLNALARSKTAKKVVRKMFAQGSPVPGISAYDYANLMGRAHPNLIHTTTSVEEFHRHHAWFMRQPACDTDSGVMAMLTPEALPQLPRAA